VIAVLPNDLPVLERWARSPTAPYRLVLRARIVLLAHRGMTIHETAATLGTTPRTVRLWRERYARGGCTGLERDAVGRGRKPALPVQTIEAIVAAGRRGARPDGRRWSIRSLAAAFGASPSAVYRICRAHGVRPGATRDS
jgi:transposase